MTKSITAEQLWLVHRTALGGVSAATGDQLPETLADNKFPAVKMSHYGMALVMARLANMADPRPPEGLTQWDCESVIHRLRQADLLPPVAPRTAPNQVTDGYHGSITIDDLEKNAKTLSETSKMFQTSACPDNGSGAGFVWGAEKNAAAGALFKRIVELVPNSVGCSLGGPIDRHDDSKTELATLAHSFKAVCEGVAASAPVTLESVAEPLRPEMTVRDLVELPEALIRELCALRGIRLADEPLRVSGAPDASCNATSATHPLIAAIDKAEVVPVSDEENARLSLVAKSDQWVSDAEFRQAVGLASSPTVDEPRIDPNQAAAVKRLEDAMCAGSLLIPGIGIAKIVDYHSRAIETFPPRRTTTLTLELNHNA